MGLQPAAHGLCMKQPMATFANCIRTTQITQ